MRKPARENERGFWPWLFFAGGALAACVALIAAFQLGRLSGGNAGDNAIDELTSAHVRSLMATHLFDVASTDRHTVKPWFEGRIDFGPDVRDFTEAGFPLLGGRLDYLASRPTAALVYRFQQHVINVFEQRALSRAETEARA